MPSRESALLVARIRALAHSLGFVRVGVASVRRLEADAEHLRGWLERGYAAELDYMAGGSDRANPAALLPEAKAVVVVALPYPASVGSGSAKPQGRAPRAPQLCGIVARYALGSDYHRVLMSKLTALAEGCSDLAGRPVLSRVCVDGAPLLERALAVEAGVGFSGDNTLCIVPGVGSRVLLGELVLDLELAPDHPLERACEHCGQCLRACPTGALVAPHLLDAGRCIAYLTVEWRGAIPRELRPCIGTRVFGCDTCQDVCPLGSAAEGPPSAPELEPRGFASAPDLVQLLELSSAAHKRLVRGSALARASRARLARNAAVALGNAAEPAAAGALSRALRSDPNPLVRSHAAWALGRLGSREAMRALEQARQRESDPDVVEEVCLALRGN
jgi:epoxyqueuosine reductase